MDFNTLNKIALSNIKYLKQFEYQYFIKYKTINFKSNIIDQKNKVQKLSSSYVKIVYLNYSWCPLILIYILQDPEQ